MTDQTKYDYVISSVDVEILSRVSDNLISLPKEDKYVAIKDRLIFSLAETKTQKSQTLLTEVKLGDRKKNFKI